MWTLALIPVAALPWLQGFFAPAASSGIRSFDCGQDAPVPMVVTADVAPDAGLEQIVASYTDGVTVLDRDHRVLARLPGFACGGSADELVAIAAGDAAIGTPVIALAVTTGGFYESSTTLTLYRVDRRGGLVPVFAGDVERHTREPDRTTRTGIVTVIPGGLVHRDPEGFVTLWTYDVAAGRYIEALSSRPST